MKLVRTAVGRPSPWGTAVCWSGSVESMLTYPEPTFTLQGTPYLEYLPVIDVSTGRLLGMEALVRWRHPTRGRISPDLLIPAAEASGDIGPLTRWIVAAACEEAA